MSTSELPEALDLERHSGAFGALTLVRGLLAIAFGLIALASPRAAAAALVIVFAVWAFVDAFFAFAGAVQRGRAHGRWGWLLFEGLVGVAAGVVALVYPGITMLALVVIVAVRAIFLGVLLVGGAMAWKSLPGRWLHVVAGVVSIVFGALLLSRPLVGALALAWTVGIYAVVFGIMSFVLGIEILGLRQLRPRGPAYGH